MKLDRPSKDSTPNRLYVEGADDFHVVCALVRKSGVMWTAVDLRIPYTPDTNGDAKALATAVLSVKNRDPRVGLVIDGDSNPVARWHEVRRRFQAVGVTLPEAYGSDGVVISTDGDRRLGVWMMPHAGQPGAVEAFVATLIPASPLKQHADASTDQARNIGATFADKDLEKARLRTWLAWQKAPGAPYGRAIDEGFLVSSSPMADALVRWFRELYLA
jgi:hypothetical protein